MRSRPGHVYQIVAVQAAFLAVGLWMHHRNTMSAATQVVENETWAVLETDAGSLAAQLRGFNLTYLAPGNAVFERVFDLLDAQRSDGGNVSLVDQDWNVVLAVGTHASSDGSNSRITWLSEIQGFAAGETPARGRIVLADGIHLAASYPLGDGQGTLLVHQPMTVVGARAAALLDSLPAISVMTFVWVCVLMSIAVYVILARHHDDLERERAKSATGTLRQTQNLVRTRDAVIFGLAKLAESRDPETGDHLERISVYSTTLASALRNDPRFRDEVTPAFIRLIAISSALHDIGKVGVEDRILLKPGPLNTEERAKMQDHARIGGDCLREIEQRLGGSNFLQMARQIAFAHHEHWDGGGYPKGLAGKAIPLSARIVAIADVYDALSSWRVYKEPFSHEKCMATILRDAGKKFDPDLVEVWLSIEEKFRQIDRQFASRSKHAVREVPVEIQAGAAYDEAAEVPGTQVPQTTGSAV